MNNLIILMNLSGIRNKGRIVLDKIKIYYRK